MLQFARDRDMNISLVLDMSDSKVHPAAGGEDEQRFIRYAVDRFAAFSNITWDLGDDLDAYRDEKWTHETGMLIQDWIPTSTSKPAIPRQNDPSGSGVKLVWLHFLSGVVPQPARIDPCVAKAAEKPGASFRKPTKNMVTRIITRSGRFPAPIPQSAAAHRVGHRHGGRLPNRGRNSAPRNKHLARQGGGWLNGRGDDTMTMFLGYGHIVDFFTGFEWWKTNPHDDRQ